MKFFSLKWKLSLSFVAFALGFVGLYVVLAKRTFESDKVSYIFESQQRQVSSFAKNLENNIERVMFDARTILSGYDFNTKQLNPAAQSVFWEHPNLLSIELNKAGENTPLITLEKKPGNLDLGHKIRPVDGQPIFKILDNNRYAIALFDNKAKGQKLEMHVVFELKEIFDQGARGQVFALTAGDQVLQNGDSDGSLHDNIKKLAQQLGESGADLTAIKNLSGERYLVSSARLGFGDLKIFSLVQESEAMGALNVLFHRSIVFLFFSFFATVIISLILSNRLTQNINSLTSTAERIGTGDFSSEPDFKSNDEVGILASAFRKMGTEIKRLLEATADKVRMEAELNTARLVQESLFPVEPFYKNAHIRLFGINKSTTECGGDWWYYYQKGSELYVLIADATGHGIPAALITAAARSMFSVVKDSDVSLKEIAHSWDKATNQCSNGKVYMTAFMMRINVEHGECVFINAGHEPIVHLKLKDGKFKGDYLSGRQNHALGEVKGAWFEDMVQLEPGDRLFLFTDGLLAITTRDGKSLSERRFLSFLEKTLTPDMPADTLVKIVDQHFQKMSDGQPLPDDVTIMALDYT